MDEKQTSYIVNFEILKHINKNNKSGIRQIVKQLENQLTTRNFDTNHQNLLIADFLMTHDPSHFLKQFEKLNMKITDIVNTPDSTKPLSHQTLRFYLIYNYFLLFRLSGKNIPFLENIHFTFRGSLKSVTALPTLPIIKLFLSKMNLLFNIGNSIRFYEHVEETHRLLEYSREIEVLKPKIIPEAKYQNSAIYGSKVYHLADLDQNSFNHIELNIIFNILMLISSILLKQSTEFDRNMVELRQKVAILKENTTFQNGDQKEEKKFWLESSLKLKLVAHIEAIADFLAVIYQVKLGEAPILNELVKTKSFFKESRLQEKYFIPVMNLIAVVNMKMGNKIVANIYLQQIVKTIKSLPVVDPERLDRLGGLSTFNNKLMHLPMEFNLFLSYFAVSEYNKTISISRSLVFSFENNFKFWYFLGLSYYNLWQLELPNLVKKDLSEKNRNIKEAVKILDRKKVKLLASYGGSFDACICSHNLNTFKNLENENVSKNIVLAISYFENSLYLLQRYYSKENLSAIFQSSIHRFKDYFNNVKQVVSNDIHKYLVSVLELLTYLYLQVNKPMQALKAISISLSSVKLKPVERAKFTTYHFKAALLLKKQNVLKTSLADLENNIQSAEKGDFQVRLGNDYREAVLPVSFVLKYNRFLAQSKDKESAKTNLPKLLEEYLKLPEKAKLACEKLIRNILFHHFYKTDFSRENLRLVTDCTFDLSNISWNKNGKN